MLSPVHKESALANAKRLFWPTFLWWRGLLLLLACEATVGGVGTYMANHGSHSARVQASFSVAAIVGAALTAFLLAFLALWATAPKRILQDEVTALSERVGTITNTVQSLAGTGTNKAVTLRVALVAVQIELGSAATVINESIDRGLWWNPEHDPLPSQQWTDHFATLTDPLLGKELHAKIALAYDRCNRLNQAIRRRRASAEAAQVFKIPPVLHRHAISENDKERLDSALGVIHDTNRSIGDYLDELEP
jgi:hypothetical protein